MNSLPNEKLGEVAMKYIQKEKEIAILKSALESTDMGEEEKGRILTFLEEGMKNVLTFSDSREKDTKLFRSFAEAVPVIH